MPDDEEKRLDYAVPMMDAKCPQCGLPSVAMVIKYSTPGTQEECARGHRWQRKEVNA